ncbi:hypothetical protein CSV77_15965 [Sporosarcina sp. P16b]|nr:hypothetical protein CSV77_15965 [Sporosarcina sp. P16b]
MFVQKIIKATYGVIYSLFSFENERSQRGRWDVCGWAKKYAANRSVQDRKARTAGMMLIENAGAESGG